MSGIEKVGLNLTALQNIGAPNITINETAGELFKELPINANRLTKGWYPFIILLSIFSFFYWILTEKTSFSRFGYSYLRGFTLATGLTSLIGASLLTSGYISMFRAVAICTLSHLIGIILTLALENKQ